MELDKVCFMFGYYYNRILQNYKKNELSLVPYIFFWLERIETNFCSVSFLIQLKSP